MKTFLESLKTELQKQKLNDQEIKEIIEDHEEMIEEAMNDGLNPEELNIKFGNPESLAKELAEYKSNEPDQSDLPKDQIKEYLFNLDEINKLNFKLLDEKITIKKSSDTTYKVICLKGNPNRYIIDVSNGELCIKRITKAGIKYRVFRPTDSCDFQLLIPNEHLLDSVMIQSKSSDITISHLNTDILNIEGLSGDIDFEEVSAKNLHLKTISGDVKMKRSIFDHIAMSLVSGNVNIDDIQIEGDVTIGTVSGDFSINNGQCNTLNYSAVSGDFKGIEFYPEKVSIRLVSGDFILENRQKEKTIEVLSQQSLSGEIKL